ncbi:hypothetical protein ACQB60_24605 [Actinomycetota bacterium Odt1-20B]
MDMADVGAIAALLSLLSIPVALVAAWWSKRGTERSHDQWWRSQLGGAATEFLRATDALTETVKRLPTLAYELRGPLLQESSAAVVGAHAPLELIAPADLLPPAGQLRDQCRYLERVALDRAVLRCAISALEGDGASGWCCSCPTEEEPCDDEQHGAAWVAWELLTRWAGKEAEERRNDRDLLDFCLRESGTLSDAQIIQVLALADRCPAGWDRLIGGWARDPLMERVESAREDFVTAARAASLTDWRTAAAPSPARS